LNRSTSSIVLEPQLEAMRRESGRLRALELRPRFRGRAWPGVVLLLVTAGLVTAKNLTVAHLPEALGGPWLLVRNAAAIAVVGALVVGALMPPGWLLAAGAPREGPIVAWAGAIGGLALGGIAVMVRRPAWAWVLIGASALLMVAVSRGGRGRFDSVAWSVTPAWLVVLVVAVVRVFRPGPEIDVLALGTIAFGTGVFEEVIFRGGLLSLAIRTRDRVVRVLVPGLAFGAWHIMDAVHDARARSWGTWADVLFVIGTVVLTALASWLVLEPLRLRSRSVVGPALLHGAVNSGLIALGFRL
jgi:membrane protease YdiL (CAAX protease family)